jgi:hypothetical protein
VVSLPAKRATYDVQTQEKTHANTRKNRFAWVVSLPAKRATYDMQRPTAGKQRGDIFVMNT